MGREIGEDVAERGLARTEATEAAWVGGLLS
jgi:hypothetical protein